MNYSVHAGKLFVELREYKVMLHPGEKGKSSYIKLLVLGQL